MNTPTEAERSSTAAVLEDKYKDLYHQRHILDYLKGRGNDMEAVEAAYQRGVLKGEQLIKDARDRMHKGWPNYEPTPAQVRALAILLFREIPSLELLGPQMDGYFAVKFAGMFVGIEKDGYTHS